MTCPEALGSVCYITNGNNNILLRLIQFVTSDLYSLEDACDYFNLESFSSPGASGA